MQSLDAHVQDLDPDLFQSLNSNNNPFYHDMRNILPGICPLEHPFLNSQNGHFVCGDNWTPPPKPKCVFDPKWIHQVKQQYPQRNVPVCGPNELAYIHSSDKNQESVCCFPAEPWMTPEILDLNKKIWQKIGVPPLPPERLLHPSQINYLFVNGIEPQFLKNSRINPQELKQELSNAFSEAQKGRYGSFDSVKQEIDEDMMIPEEIEEGDLRDALLHDDQEGEQLETLEDYLLNHIFFRVGVSSIKDNPKLIQQIYALYKNELRRKPPPKLLPFKQFIDTLDDKYTAKLKRFHFLVT